MQWEIKNFHEQRDSQYTYARVFSIFKNPFVLDLDDIPRAPTKEVKESLIKLSCSESLKIEFAKSKLDELWVKIKNKYPSLSV